MNWDNLQPFKSCQKANERNRDFFWCRVAEQITGSKHSVHKSICFYCEKERRARQIAAGNVVFQAAAEMIDLDQMDQILKGKIEKNLLREAVLKVTNTQNEFVNIKPERVLALAQRLGLD